MPSLFALLPLVALISVFVAIDRLGFKKSVILPLGYLSWMSIIAVGGRVLSAFNLLGSTKAWVVINLGMVAGFIICVKQPGTRKRLRRPRTAISMKESLFRELREIPLGLVLVIGGTALLFLIGAMSNILLSQTMDDSLTAYLARAGLWIQNGNTHPIVTSDYNFVINAYPAFPSFSTVNWIVLARDDGFAAFDQWLGCVANASLVYLICRQLGGSLTAGLISASLWISMPTILLQSQMVLTDQVALTGALLAVSFFLEWLETRSTMSIVIAFFGLLVLCGSKQTGFFVGPALLMVLLPLMVRASRRKQFMSAIRQIFRSPWTYFLLPVAFLNFAFEYVQNYRYYGHFLGPPASFEYFAAGNVDFTSRVESIITSGKKVIVAGLFADIPPWIGARVPALRDWAQDTYINAMNGTTRLVGVGWFGFVQTLCAVAVTPFLIVVWRDQRTRFRLIALSCLGLGYLSTLFFVRTNFSEAFSRYSFLTVSLLIIPTGMLYDAVAERGLRKRLAGAAVGVVLVLALAQGSWSFFGNGIRPLIGPKNVWNQSTYEQFRNVQGFVAPEDIGRVLHLIDKCIPANGALIMDDLYKFPISPLFGPAYRRKVFFVERPYPTNITRLYLRRRGANAILLTEELHQGLDYVGPRVTSASFGSLHLLFINPQTPLCDGALAERPF